MKLLDKYYKYNFGPDVLIISERLNLNFDFVIEAGCHDGTDTEKLVKKLNDVKVYAFEPDSKARLAARKKLSAYIPKQILISSFALSDHNGKAFLVFEGVGMDGAKSGSGSSRVSKQGSQAIQLRTLDNVLPDKLRKGLLWLDVEGHAVQVLKGATKTLKKIVLAKIEIQMHDMGTGRKADLFAVVNIMKQADLIPIYGPLNPGYFGDIIFVHRDLINRKNKIKSVLILLQLYFLHSIVYPTLNKPKKLNS